MKYIFEPLRVVFLITCFSILGLAQTNADSVGEAAKVLNTCDIKGAIALLDRVIEKKENLFQAYRFRAGLRGMMGNLKGQFDDLTKALELKPGEGELYESRANTRMFLGYQPDEILADLDLAIANGRKIESVYSLRAQFKRQTGDLEGALADFETAVGLNPDSAGAVVGLAGVYDQKGDTERAIVILENFVSKYEIEEQKLPTVEGKVVAQNDTIIMRDEKRDVIAGSRGVIIKDDDEPKPLTPEAGRARADRMEQTKNTASAYSELAGLYKKKGEFEKAMVLVEKSIVIDPTDKTLFGERGTIKASMKDYEGALADFTVAIKGAPSFPKYYVERGIVLLFLNRDADAQKDFNKFSEIVRNSSALTYLENRIAEAKKQRLEQI